MLLTQGSWDEVRDRLNAYIGINWITRPDEIRKNTNKGITELSNILMVKLHSVYITVTWVF